MNTTLFNTVRKKTNKQVLSNKRNIEVVKSKIKININILYFFIITVNQEKTFLNICSKSS